MIGKVAKCSKGILGVVEDRKELSWGLSWVGRRVDNGAPWASRNPEVVAESFKEFDLDMAEKAVHKADGYFKHLEGYHGSRLIVAPDKCKISVNFSVVPDGLTIPEHLDIDGYEVSVILEAQ